MIGSFDYARNCSLPHYIPMGMTDNGFPVIVFPRKTHDITIGRRYNFLIQMTVQAKYIADGVEYRVGHAMYLHDAADQEGDEIDGLVYSPHERVPPALATNPVLQQLAQSLGA